jgi:pimeloyl-ACP methyl ester carboxylesterase
MHEVYGDPSKVTDSAVQRYFDLALRAGNRAAFISFVNQFQLPDTTLIKQIHTPTLIMWGEKDRWIPLAHGNSFARDIAGSKLIVYPGLGHIPMEEDAALTCKDALNFFAGTGAETTLK